MSEPTLSLNKFLEKYKENDNEWWYLQSGDMQNLFEEAVDRVEQLKEVLTISLEFLLRQDDEIRFSPDGMSVESIMRHGLDGS